MRKWHRGERPITGEVILYKGYYIRQDTTDVYVPGQLRSYEQLPVEGEVVLDLGAHIGAFTKRVHDRGAAYCYCVEPVPDNVRLWKLNAAGTASVLLEGLVLGEDDMGGEDFIETEMYLSRHDTTGHTYEAVRGRDPLKVFAYSLKYVLEQSRATVVKMDIEGSEYNIMADAAKLFPEFGITHFVAELHLNHKGQRAKALEFIELFHKRYRYIVQPVVGESNWNTCGVWELR